LKNGAAFPPCVVLFQRRHGSWEVLLVLLLFLRTLLCGSTRSRRRGSPGPSLEQASSCSNVLPATTTAHVVEAFTPIQRRVHISLEKDR